MIFLNSASTAAPLVFYLPSEYTHTETKGKPREARVRIYFKTFEKTQYLLNTLYLKHKLFRFCSVISSKNLILQVNPWLYRLGKLNGRQKETGLLSGQNGHQRESELVSVETGGKNQNEKFIDD